MVFLIIFYLMVILLTLTSPPAQNAIIKLFKSFKKWQEIELPVTYV